MSTHDKLLSSIVVVVLIFATVFLSGCTEEHEGQVGIPGDAGSIGDYHEEENRVEITIPIWNTYDEDKSIVVRFMVETLEENVYDGIEMLELPADSEDEYSHSINIPEDESPEDVEARILVWEDEFGIVEVSGEHLENSALVNVTIGNTLYEEEEIAIQIEVETEEDIYRRVKSGVNLPETSMEEYQEEITIPEGEEPVDYSAEII